MSRFTRILNLACCKAGTLPQMRQCHAGTLIQGTVFRPAIAVQINNFCNLGIPPRYGRRAALFPGVRGDLMPPELRPSSNAC